MKQDKIIVKLHKKPRNLVVLNSFGLKAGAHQKNNKSKRKNDKQNLIKVLKQELENLALVRYRPHFLSLTSDMRFRMNSTINKFSSITVFC